jgi:Patatin-like phospholipase
MKEKVQGQKNKWRGFVMTGGGAKGFYEAGVIHALHITGMEFDVITGSSIGAINSVFFGEYLYRKHQLPADVRQDPLHAIEKMNDLIRAYHHAWLQLPDKKVVDDSETGPLGKIKGDLLDFNLSLPQVVRLGWWWTDPGHGTLPPPGVWGSLIGLGSELIERLGGSQELLRIIKDWRESPVREAARTYLARFGMDRSLVPPADDHKLRDAFTQPISPLRTDHLTDGVSMPDPDGTELLVLVEPDRTLRDFSQEDIAVRVTRANYRTGRLEISAFVRVEDFVRFLKKQAWKLKALGPEKLPLGNFRIQVPGNPNALSAGLCSGRFPGVFAPFPVENLYPNTDPDNQFLSRLLSGWLSDPEVEKGISQAYYALDSHASEEKFRKDFNEWQDQANVGDYFPQTNDTYVDGGSIDNTPSSSAVDYVREQLEQKGISRREALLDLYVIFLEAEPKVSQDKAKDPAIFEVVARTLAIQGAANRSSDTNTVGTINAFGQHGEDLGRVLQAMTESYREALKGLDPSKAQDVQEALLEKVRSLLVHDLSEKMDSESANRVIDQIERWSEKMIAGGLPLNVNVVRIYPEKMPLDTLQFTERLGYRKENAILALTMGCYDTLAAMRRHLEQGGPDLDALDRQSLDLVRMWMGGSAWPKDSKAQDKFIQVWHCQRNECVFHAGFCKHGTAEVI